MVKQHLKRLASPRTWPIHKKTLTFVTRPNPGPHKMEHQTSITVVLRDLLGVVTTKKEAKFILHNKDCLVDGKVIYDDKYPVGLMDVVSIPKLDKYYRMVITPKNKLVAVSIDKQEANTKPVKITSKKNLKGGKVQLGTSDGRTILIEKDTYKVSDTLIIEVPTQKIVKHIPLTTKTTIKLVGGSHVGVVGQVRKMNDDIVFFNVGEDKFHTSKKYALVVGEDKPAVTVKQA